MARVKRERLAQLKAKHPVWRPGDIPKYPVDQEQEAAALRAVREDHARQDAERELLDADVPLDLSVFSDPVLRRKTKEKIEQGALHSAMLLSYAVRPGNPARLSNPDRISAAKALLRLVTTFRADALKRAIPIDPEKSAEPGAAQLEHERVARYIRNLSPVQLDNLLREAEDMKPVAPPLPPLQLAKTVGGD